MWKCSKITLTQMRATNMYGYPAHFDLQNANLQVKVKTSQAFVA